MPKYQDNRSVKVTSPFGAGVLLLSQLSGVERISEPFTFELALMSEHGDLNPDRILGKPLGLELTSASAQPLRYFHGIVCEFAQRGFGEYLHEYRALLRPWYWMLTGAADCRIFQDKAVPDIFEEVCRQAGFADIERQLACTYRPRAYCVQYRERSFDFLNRLLEEEGIFYYFRHAQDKHVLVLCDDVGKCGAVAGYDSVPFYAPATLAALRERDHLESWTFQKSVQPGAFATRAYDFQRPTSAAAGACTLGGDAAPAKLETFDYPARANPLTSEHLEHVARIRAQEMRTGHMVASGHGNAVGLTTGRVFRLTNYPRPDLNRQYLITSVSIELSNNAFETGSAARGADCEISIQAVDSREPYRPARVTPRPRIHGAQTALVVGPKGEEIHTDMFGRVKVQFHWDRYGSSDENSSCFIRVAQLWSGRGWGGMHIPRIGQEVVVSFLEGDPDDPLIIGGVYNGSNRPPHALPDNKTRSGVLSRSSPGGTAEHGNELCFEDRKGSEHVLLHAEKDQTLEVENDESHWVGHDRTKRVQNDETNTIGHDRVESVGDSESISIGKNRTESVGESESVEIGKNRTHQVGGQDRLSVGKQLLIDAGDEVTIQAGAARLTLKKDGTVLLNGQDISLKGDGKVQVKAAADVIIKGGRVVQN